MQKKKKCIIILMENGQRTFLWNKNVRGWQQRWREDTEGRGLQRVVSDGEGSSLQCLVPLARSQGRPEAWGRSASTLPGGPLLTSGTWTT